MWKKKVPSYLNKTHIAIIPKVQGLEIIGNYRPISLCNTAYKIITKITVARLRPILGEFISPFQRAFLPRRRGTDNDIIVQELIHTISKKNGRVGYMAIKIDLEEAYNKLEWSFITDILGKVNLSKNLIQVIMSCMSTISTIVLFNRGYTEEFCPSKGIRQGDPLFPYLLIICMDYLGQFIQEMCEENIWIPIKPLEVDRPFLIYSLLTTLCCLLELTTQIVQPYEIFWMSFVLFLDKLSVNPSLDYISPPMWIVIQRNPSVISLVFSPFQQL